MSNQTRKLSGKKKLAFYFVTCLVPVVFISAIYILYPAYRIESLYRYVKHNELAFKGKIHKPDQEFGYVPIPDSCGAEVFPIGNDVEACYDKYGFHVPAEDRKGTVLSQHPAVLALGCSFTCGFSTKAEETYPYLVGRDLGGTTRNAGVCSYGLSKMIEVSVIRPENISNQEFVSDIIQATLTAAYGTSYAQGIQPDLSIKMTR